MKKIFSFFAAAAMLSMAFSCTKPDPTDPVKPDPEKPTPSETAITEITATLQGAGVKTAWAEGDVLTVYAVTDEGDKDAQYTLSAGAGTATGTFKAATGVKEGANAYYATTGTPDFAQHNTFSFTLEAEQTAANPIFGTSADGKAYTVSTPLAGIELKITGKGNAARIAIEDKNTNNIINGNATYNAKTAKFAIKNGAASKNTVAKTYEAVALGETAVSFMIEVPEGTLDTGASIVVYNPANGEIGRADIPAQTLAKGTLTTVNVALAASSSVADLSAVESANCYLITEPGTYKFKTVKGNSPENVGTTAKAEIIWETYGNNEDVAANSVVAEVSYASDYITFKTPETLKPGNALIAAKDASGVILWSWHIWVTDKEIKAVDYGFVNADDVAEGAIMMNYNIGATGEVGTPESFGVFYQWGRKDPFVSGNSVAEEEMTFAKISGTPISFRKNEVPEGGASMEYATQHPTEFVMIMKDAGDPDRDWQFPHNNEGWGATKTVYDPCPIGWRVPTKEEASFQNTEKNAIKEAIFDGAFYFEYNNGTKLPLTPTVNYDSGDGEGFNAEMGLYHTASYKSDGFCNAMRWSGGAPKNITIRRKAEAGAIRCVKDVPAAE